MQPQDTSIANRLSHLVTVLSLISETPHLDARVLLSHVLHTTSSWILAHPEASISPDQVISLNEMTNRLVNGEPLPYVLGHWEFYGLDFQLTPDVLIPRPETELLVEHALSWLITHPGSDCVVDIGTGSGCIAISLIKKLPHLRFLATDISLQSLKVAQRNAQYHGVEDNIEFIQGDLLECLHDRFDLICANLPYIPQHILASLSVSHHEPALALDGGQDGMAKLSKLISQAKTRLSSEGLLLLEIEAGQGEAARACAKDSFPSAIISVFPDLAGRDRLLQINNR